MQETVKLVSKGKSLWGSLIVSLLIMGFFILSVDMMTKAFQQVGQNTAQEILSIVSNPFVGLFAGLLITALIQSSSTCTSMIIALVAAQTISIQDAIPIVMGANIGTTLTSTIVAFGFISQKKSFRRAISAAMLHDFFNIFTVLILFPLELRYHVLSSVALWFTEGVFTQPEWLNFSIPFPTFDSDLWLGWIHSFFGGNDWLMLIVSFIFLFASIKLLSQIIYKQLIARPQNFLQNYLFCSTKGSFSSGFLLTGLVQSSSITTSLVVPLIASSKISIRQGFPFVMGANVGTTITAFIAAYSHSKEALAIAFVHLLINVFGATVLLPFHQVRNIPEKAASYFGKLTMKNRLYGFVYIILMFFVIPFFLIYLSK